MHSSWDKVDEKEPDYCPVNLNEVVNRDASEEDTQRETKDS